MLTQPNQIAMAHLKSFPSTLAEFYIENSQNFYTLPSHELRQKKETHGLTNNACGRKPKASLNLDFSMYSMSFSRR
jgi:hypothetical protein